MTTPDDTTVDIPDALAHLGLELRETHISWVFLGEMEVWKIKKPVDLGFLDFTTLDKRKAACEAEVRLNRRLAPSVYLGVIPVRREGTSVRLGGAVTDTGDLVDWAVHMRRLPDEDRADERLERNALTDAHVEAVAMRLARFHAARETDEETSRFGSVETVGGNLRENFEQARETLLDYLSEEQAREIEAWQTRFLSENEELFAERIRAGRVRDGHGDLRLEHVYLDDETGDVTIVDCIEFNDRFRYADVCADVVFLAMDLARSGRVDLAERFLAIYARESDDYDLYPMVDFYESYRAFVRGKIAAMVAASPKVDHQARERSRTDARRYYLLALASERRPLMPPALVAVGGIIASGKSTLAARLARETSIPVIDADRTRKSLAGLAPTAPAREDAWQGIYSSEFTERTYDELERRARAVISTGRPVIIDASFRSARHRASARALAERLGVPFAFVECRASEEVCRRRLRERAGGVSDGRLEIFDDFVAKWEPVTELAPSAHIVADTEAPIEETLAELRKHVPLSFAKLTE